MCIQLCTRRYTVVYTRVYSPPLSRRDTLDISTARTRIPHLRSMLLDYFALALGVISCVGPLPQPPLLSRARVSLL